MLLTTCALNCQRDVSSLKKFEEKFRKKFNRKILVFEKSQKKKNRMMMLDLPLDQENVKLNATSEDILADVWNSSDLVRIASTIC